MRLLLILLLFSSFLSITNLVTCQEKYETTISYSEGENSGEVRFRCSFDHMMGELLVKAVAKVESYEGCEPGVLNVTVIYMTEVQRFLPRHFQTLYQLIFLEVLTGMKLFLA